MPNVLSVGFHCNTAVANYKLKPLKLYWLFTVFLWTSKLPIMDVSHLLLRIHNNPVSHNSFTLRLWLNQRVQPRLNFFRLTVDGVSDLRVLLRGPVYFLQRW